MVSHLAFSSRFHAYKCHNPVLKVVSKLYRLQVVSCSQISKGCLKQWSLTWLPSCDFILRNVWTPSPVASCVAAVQWFYIWNSSSLSPAVVQRFHACWSFQCAVTMLSLLSLSFSVVTLVVKRSDYNSRHVLYILCVKSRFCGVNESNYFSKFNLKPLLLRVFVPSLTN